MSKKKKIIIVLIILFIWMLLIFKLSSMNSNNSNGHSMNIISIFIEDALDITNNYGITNSHPSNEKINKASYLINSPLRKVIHATVYFVLAFFMMILLSILFDHKHYIKTIFIVLIMCFIFASSDEFHQFFVNGRTGQFIDVIIDTLGAIIGIIFYTTYHIVYINGQKSISIKKVQ